MTAGGTSAAATLADVAACPVAAAVPAGDPWPPTGFRHLFPELGAPSRAVPDRAERDRLVALSRAMQARDPLGAEGDNPNIPAGYTYLLQFVAHDLVRTETPFWGVGTIGRATRDLAAARLRLDSLYGGGPANCPFAYRTGARERLRIAPIAPDQRDGAAGPPLRDIPRTRLDPPDPAWVKGRKLPLDEALLVDPRNDDNSNVAQVTVLFAAFHNAIVDRLVAGRGAPLMAYSVAREAATLVYRRILREDLLRRLLHPAVLEHYAELPPNEFLDPGGAAMPLEFCAGAFRFGHAMVRETYHINEAAARDLGEILRATSGGGAGAMPLSRAWIIRWSRFFALGGGLKPNLSRRLRPQHSPGLLDTRFFPRVDETDQIGLAYRDLLVAGLAGMHPVARLWEHVAGRLPQLAAKSALSDADARREALRAWFAAAGLGAADADALAATPPLPFYILFEAEKERDGLSLGVLGSVIVAEAMLGILKRDPLPCERPGEGMEGALVRLENAAKARAGTLAPLGRIADMPGLVRFAEKAKEIGKGSLPFI